MPIEFTQIELIKHIQMATDVHNISFEDHNPVFKFVISGECDTSYDCLDDACLDLSFEIKCTHKECTYGLTISGKEDD